ncbi:MAG: hypothetical protein K8E24_012590 [Methanobacterium paludis]|nr:hypothetical protein [Methanobacterium paludis]
MAYSTADQIRRYAPGIEEDDFTDTELVGYADSQDALIINPILLKQYDLSEVTETGTVKELSAMCAAKAAMKSLYGEHPQDKARLGPDISKLEDDINAILKQIKVGEIRL